MTREDVVRSCIEEHLYVGRDVFKFVLLKNGNWKEVERISKDEDGFVLHETHLYTLMGNGGSLNGEYESFGLALEAANQFMKDFDR
jgi:hypothetical protein